MENTQLTEKEMEKIRLAYTFGKTIVCPRGDGDLSYWREEGDLIFGQMPRGPVFDYLVVMCPQGHS